MELTYEQSITGQGWHLTSEGSVRQAMRATYLPAVRPIVIEWMENGSVIRTPFGFFRKRPPRPYIPKTVEMGDGQDTDQPNPTGQAQEE